MMGLKSLHLAGQLTHPTFPWGPTNPAGSKQAALDCKDVICCLLKCWRVTAGDFTVPGLPAGSCQRHIWLPCDETELLFWLQPCCAQVWAGLWGQGPLPKAPPAGANPFRLSNTLSWL